MKHTVYLKSRVRVSATCTLRTTRESERAVGEAGKRMYVVLREGAQARRCYTIYVGIFYMYVDI